MIIEIIFLGIIVVYVFLGAKKGGIYSLGGLIALVLSWILSRALAVPITKQLFKLLNIESIINSFIGGVGVGLQDSADIVSDTVSSSGLFNIGDFGVTGIINSLTQSITGIVDNTALKIGSMFTMFMLFSVCMIICRIILQAIEKTLQAIPLGKTLNGVLGIACGLIKGILVVLILYFILAFINTVFKTNIPINSGFFTDIMQLFSIFNKG